MPVSLERLIAEVEPAVVTVELTRDCIKVTTCSCWFLSISSWDLQQAQTRTLTLLLHTAPLPTGQRCRC